MPYRTHVFKVQDHDFFHICKIEYNLKSTLFTLIFSLMSTRQDGMSISVMVVWETGNRGRTHMQTVEAAG